jgi:hypothetical protein
MAEEMTSAEVRSKLVEALRLDLVGPGIRSWRPGGGAGSGSLALVSDRVPCSAGCQG